MLAAALLASAATAHAAAVNAAPATDFSARGVTSLGGLLGATDNQSPTGYVYIDSLELGQDLGVDGKSVYVGKDDQGIQLFQFSDGSVAPLTFAPGDTQDIPIKENGVCEGCKPTSGHAKREISIRDLPGSIGANGDSPEAGNADFGDDIKIGDDVGASVGLDGAKYVGKDDDGTQLFQFKDGDIAPIVLAAADKPVDGASFNEETGLCEGCIDSSGWTQKRSVGEELEMAERDAEANAIAERDAEVSEHEPRFLLTILGLLGLKIKIGKAILFGPGRWRCEVARGGYINIRGCRKGTYIGIKHGVYAGCNPRGVQLYHFPGWGVAPLRCRKGPVRHGWQVDHNTGVCSSCHHWGWHRGWWKRDEIVEERNAESTDVAERSEHEERFLLGFLGLLGLKVKIGAALLLGKGRVRGYWAHGGYINIPRCRPGTHIGINDGVYVGCDKNGVQLFKWGHGGVGPLKCSRGPVRQGCKVVGNICDVCHHDGHWGWGHHWKKEIEALD